MPHTYTWEPGGLYRQFTATISGDEILESNFELQVHPDFKKIDYIINDFTAVTGHSIKSAHTNTYASTDEIASSNKGDLKVAIVVVQGPLVALANNYREQMIDNKFECDVFQTVEDAREWVCTE